MVEALNPGKYGVVVKSSRADDVLQLGQSREESLRRCI